MTRTIKTAVTIATVLLAASCVKAPVSEKNELSKKYLDAWVSVNHPGAPTTTLGSYILSDTPGSGDLIGDSENSPFVYCLYESTDLEGNVLKTTDEGMAKQLGSYDQTEYYGPTVVFRGEGYIDTGIREMMESMRVGGTRTALIPGWLMNYEVYDSAEEYYKNESGTDAIYTFTILESISDIVKWEIDSLKTYMAHNHAGVDSTSFGYYYIQTQAPSVEEESEDADKEKSDSDSKAEINYTGRLLNGRVFDTTIADTAKVYGLYNESKTYAPVEVNLSSEEDSMPYFSSEGDMIKGFAKCIKSMKAGEKGICVFYSDLGYGLQGSGAKIPSFSPLIFEIEMLVEEKEEKEE